MSYREPQTPGIGGVDELTSAEETFIQNLAALSYVQGDILYYNGTALTRLGIGTATQVLTVNAGATAPQWSTGSSGLIVGTTTITSGTTTRILYDNAGVLGEYTLTGTGTVAVMQNTPTLTTPVLGAATGTSLALGGALIAGEQFSIIAPTANALARLQATTTAGVARVRVEDSTTNVQLNVFANGSATGTTYAGVSSNSLLVIDGSGSAASGLAIGMNTSDPLYLYTNNTLRMTFGATGRLDIAVSPTSTAVSGAAILNTMSATTGMVYAFSDGTLKGGIYNNGTQLLFGSESNHPVGFYTSNGLVKLLVGTSGAITMDFDMSSAVHLLVTGANGQYAKVKTTSANNASGWYTEDSTGNATVAMFQWGTTSGATPFGIASAGLATIIADGTSVTGLAIGTATSDPLYFGTNNLTRFSIDADGDCNLLSTIMYGDTTNPKLTLANTGTRLQYGSNGFTVGSGNSNILHGNAYVEVSTTGLLSNVSDAVTNTVTDVLKLQHDTSGTAAAAFGTGLLFQGESSTTATQDMGRLSYAWSVATHASRSADFRVSTTSNATDVPRSGVLGKYTTLTESSATAFASVTLSTGDVVGGVIEYAVEANDATDYQGLTGICPFSIVNKAGTLTLNLGTDSQANAVSTGTLTGTLTLTDATGGVAQFKMNAVSSLTQTVLRINCQIRKNFGTGAILAI